MFSYVNTRIVDAALAVYILIFLAQERGWMNWLSHAGKAVPEHVIPHITSVIGGFIQGTTGTGGPTVIPLHQNQHILCPLFSRDDDMPFLLVERASPHADRCAAFRRPTTSAHDAVDDTVFRSVDLSRLQGGPQDTDESVSIHDHRAVARLCLFARD